MATDTELLSLIDRGFCCPAMSPGAVRAFPFVQSSYYWSATTYVGDTSGAWYVYFSSGNVNTDTKSGADYV
jgi:hypothetical protein